MIGGIIAVVLGASLYWDEVTTDVDGQPEVCIVGEIELRESVDSPKIRVITVSPVGGEFESLLVDVEAGEYVLACRVSDRAGNWSDFSVLNYRVEDRLFVRADANQDQVVDIADVIFSLNVMFLGAQSSCNDAMDVNDDGRIDIADAIRLLVVMFDNPSLGIALPFPNPGSDRTADAISCR